MKKPPEQILLKPSLDPLDQLLHPASAFETPQQVFDDPDLTLNEKRAILASWASDACAVDSAPSLRCTSVRRDPVSVDEVLEALRKLDRDAWDGSPTLKRRLRSTFMDCLKAKQRKPGSDDSGQGVPL